GGDESPVTKTTCTVVVETSHRGETIAIGVMADAVSEVIDFTAEQIEPPPSFGTHVRVDYLLGMGKLDRKLVLLLDIDRLLSPVELEQAVGATDAVPA
ncbi:MAG TPA: chemotaxis protein CheW, partial [Thermoanaerobaculia bacterium]